MSWADTVWFQPALCCVAYQTGFTIHNWYVLHTVCYFPVADLMLTTSNRGIGVYQHTLQIHSMLIIPSIWHSCMQGSGTDLCWPLWCGCLWNTCMFLSFFPVFDILYSVYSRLLSWKSPMQVIHGPHLAWCLHLQAQLPLGSMTIGTSLNG